MKEKIVYLFNKIRSSKDGKTLIANFGYLSILQVIGYVFPLITMPYLANVIGVDGFGKIAFGAAVAGWLMTIVDWGFTSTATRDVARCRDDIAEVSKIYSNVLWARLGLMVISFLILGFFLFYIPQFSQNRLIILASILSIPGYILFPDWLFQALERMKFTTIFNLIIKLIFTCLVFLLIKTKEDYILQPILQALGYVVVGILAQYIILYRWKIRIRFPVPKEVFQTIKSSADVFFSNIIPSTYENVLVVFLGMKCGDFANGILSAGTKFMNIALNFIRILSRTFFPFLSRRIDKHYVFVKISLLVAIFFAVVMIIFAPLLIKLFFGDNFTDAVLIHQICSISIIFQTLINVYGTNYLIITHHEKVFRNIILFSSLFGCLIGYLGIVYFDVIGAATAIVLVNGSIGVLAYIKSRQCVNKNGNYV